MTDSAENTNVENNTMTDNRITAKAVLAASVRWAAFGAAIVIKTVAIANVCYAAEELAGEIKQSLE